MHFRYHSRFRFNPDDPDILPSAAEIKARTAAMLEAEESPPPPPPPPPPPYLAPPGMSLPPSFPPPSLPVKRKRGRPPKNKKEVSPRKSDLAEALAGLSETSRPKATKKITKKITKGKPSKGLAQKIIASGLRGPQLGMALSALGQEGSEGSYRCGKCNQLGHNARTCGMAKISKKVPAKDKQSSYQCGRCHRFGHNARTCKNKKIKSGRSGRPKKVPAKVSQERYRCGKCNRLGHNARTCGE